MTDLDTIQRRLDRDLDEGRLPAAEYDRRSAAVRRARQRPEPEPEHTYEALVRDRRPMEASAS